LLAHDRDLILDGDVARMERMKLGEPFGGDDARLQSFRMPLPGREAARSTTFRLRSLDTLFRSRWAMRPNRRCVVIALRSCRESPDVGFPRPKGSKKRSFFRTSTDPLHSFKKSLQTGPRKGLLNQSWDFLYFTSASIVNHFGKGQRADEGRLRPDEHQRAELRFTDRRFAGCERFTAISLTAPAPNGRC
jgi:hypothetical protein